jgi:hypothetical protein
VGVPGATPRGGANGAERGGPGSRSAGDNAGGAAMASKTQQWRGVAMPRGRPNKGGEKAG